MMTTGIAGIRRGGNKRRAIKVLLATAAFAAAWHHIPVAGAAETAAASTPQQLAQGNQVYRFDIPAKPLAQAIADLSAVTGIQVLYTQDQPFTHEAPPLHGSYTVEQALAILLQSSGLTYRFTRPDAVTLIAQGTPSSGGGPAMLGPITVHGEKTDRSLMDTATSVAVFDDQSLQQRPGLASTNDLIDRVPNVTTTGTNAVAPTIRGIDGTGPAQGGPAFVAGIRPRLNLQVDGRPVSFNELVFGDTSLWDVDQVEVLRGPQSTLQGRNAIAGAIIVKTKDPTWDYEGGARLMAGNSSNCEGAAYISGPIVDDQLAFRLAVDRKTSESFLEFTPYPQDDHPGEFESTTMRGKLLFEPRKLDGFSTLLTLNYTETKAPQFETVVWPVDGLTAAYPKMPVFKPRSTSGTAETTWQLSDALTFENTLSATDLLVKRLASPGDGYVKIDGYEFQEEPRLRFTGADGRLKGMGGLHLYRAKQDEIFQFAGDNAFADSTTTLAGFGEATYEVVQDIDVTLGGRLEREERRRVTTGGTAFPVDFDETYDVFLPKIGAAWHANKEWTFGAVVSRGYNAGGAGATFGTPFTTYTYAPEYVWNYETYTRASLLDGRLDLTGNIFFADYKGMQLPFDLGPTSTVIRNADRAVTYGSELGAKWLAMKGLTLFGNVGLLKTEITDYPGSGIEGNDLANSPALTADLGFTYKDPSGFDLSSDVRYSEAYYSDVDNTPRGKVDPYWIANAQAGYTFSSLRVFAFVNNLFDNQSELSISVAGNSANIIRPRTFGLGAEMTF